MMQQPDIFFIVLDTQRADRLGSYGYAKAHTPNLDAFARNAVQFQQAVSPAQWTIPSHASMFTGLYPSSHQVTQSSQKISGQHPHLAELLRGAGYQTVAFCNNPLVGILNNGFQRGFNEFYNYGGAFPNRPQPEGKLPFRRRLRDHAENILRRHVAAPIQNFFGRNDWAFRLSLNSSITPLWSQLANFKGQNERSVGDLCHYLEARESNHPDQPLFLFLNLMETHLPFWPPQKYIDQAAPYFQSTPEAATIMRTWNREAFRWASPLAEPLPQLEADLLSDLYDAEVAYQDAYLGQLLTLLKQRKNQRNTLTIFVGDHGDGLGEHQYFGHAFVAYEELIHVPLILDWPARWEQGRQIDTPVSTRRIFHTMLAAARKTTPPEADVVSRLDLHQTVLGNDGENGTAYSEVYPPLNFINVIEHRQPELLETFRCRAVRRAVVRDNLKLIHVDEQADELFDLTADPLELDNQLQNRSSEARLLSREINRQKELAELEKATITDGDIVDADDQLLEHLRNLGYIE